ncbi:MAG: hypothetical protein ACAH95_14800 [Fimbriimonas sp.]
MRPLFLLTLACITPLGSAEVKVEKIDYKGWPGSFRVTNGTIDVVVVPQVGRVMRYGYVDAPNVLWENETLLGKTFAANARTYRNYGGDKIWVAPQSLWTWPPDPATDGKPWQVDAIANGVRMTSPVGNLQKVQFRREITLSQAGSEVSFRNSMENKGSRMELAIWQVTQVNNPDFVTLPFEITASQPKGWYGYGTESINAKFQSLSGGNLVIKRDPAIGRKFGARSLKGNLSAVIGATRFFSESPAFSRVPYPDKNSAQQVYVSPDPYKYAELEHAGPLTRMEHGEMVLQSVKWRLERG